MNNLPEKWCINLLNAPDEVINFFNENGECPPYYNNRSMYAHYPAVSNHITTTGHVFTGYTEITHEQFLNAYKVYPVVIGENHHIRAFWQDLVNLGLTPYEGWDKDLCLTDNSKLIRFNSNSFEKIHKGHYIIVTNYRGNYTGDNVFTKQYRLPNDWDAALNHFKKCKEHFDDRLKNEINIGDLVMFCPDKCVGKYAHCKTNHWNYPYILRVTDIDDDGNLQFNGKENQREFLKYSVYAGGCNHKDLFQKLDETFTQSFDLGDDGKLVVSKTEVLYEGGFKDFSIPLNRLKTYSDALNLYNKLNGITS